MVRLAPTTQLTRQHADETDLAMMRRAIELASNAADALEVPVGAVVYQGKRIIAEAHNLCEADRDATAHAELLALREASAKVGDWRLSECSLAVTLEPCVMCAGAIVNARVGRLVYGTADPRLGAVESLYQICDDRRIHHRPEIVQGVLAPECRRILRDFFKMRRAQNKAAKLEN